MEDAAFNGSMLTAEPGTIYESGANNTEDNDETLRASERARRLQELRQLAIEEQEHKLIEQQKRLEKEARQLANEKRQLATRRSDNEEKDHPPGTPYRNPNYSQSYTHMAIPSLPSAVTSPKLGSSSPPSRQPQKFTSPRKTRLSLTSSSTTSLVNSADPLSTTLVHPRDCNCVSCVLNRPADAINSANLRVPKSEKPKGFFRRLSMEVGNTFSLTDGGRKRSNSNLNLQSAVHAATFSNSGYYAPGSGIGSNSSYGTDFSSSSNEHGVLSQRDYASSRR